jgi:GTPase Era involved in 16S rRNA processing
MQRLINYKFNHNNSIKSKSIFLVGDTNVGKTTLLYYLSGMKLNLITNQLKKTK